MNTMIMMIMMMLMTIMLRPQYDVAMLSVDILNDFENQILSTFEIDPVHHVVILKKDCSKTEIILQELILGLMFRNKNEQN